MPRRASRRSHRSTKRARTSPTRRRSPYRRRTATLPLYAPLTSLRARSPSLRDIVRAQSVVNALSLSPQQTSATRGASLAMLQSAVRQVISKQNTIHAFNQATNLGDGPAVSAAIVKATKPILTNLVTGDEQRQLAAALEKLDNHFSSQAEESAVQIAIRLLASTIETVGITLLYILCVAVILFMTVSECSQFKHVGCIINLTLSYSLYQKLLYTIYMKFMNLGPFVAQAMVTATMYAIKLPYFTLSYGIMPVFNWVMSYFHSKGVPT